MKDEMTQTHNKGQTGIQNASFLMDGYGFSKLSSISSFIPHPFLC